ncbi:MULTISPECIES: hypothetical protein [Pseudoalteromonas]|uniref:hypothetical protein n=1 Tax=Pseudoalteromonas TaxID=53246 RepID=UPI0002317C69|nr:MULTISPECIES: hypothetical protein [Pseudoalteromonas]MBH0001021.1 hypothetical protein [Pseudoalteromonas sp. NSLLW24]MBH0016396.1 hypothetical protein [Pseudoalteromonas sp. NGC95]MBH0033261.1 hypothetical protein [Pseudoalteromonas sp. NZS71_1]MBH0079019.1 hypothetical protein [Pseudoalteromonas sp. NZS11]MBZ2191093.1 hypothetical protein [Pseudoalteromonas arctica]
MKHSIKIAMASLLVLGSAQVHATEVDLDVTDILTQSVASYVKQTTIELEKSLKETLYFDAKTVLEGLLDEPVLTDSTTLKNTDTSIKNVK